MSQQEFCKHFTREWLSDSGLSLQAKKGLGEHKVLDALLVLTGRAELIEEFNYSRKAGIPISMPEVRTGNTS